MPLERIKRLRDCGVFRDFTWSADLPDFGRFNLIYGWNGSGKTTLSRLLRSLETKLLPSGGQVTFTVDGNDVANTDISQVTLPIRVFNRDFVDETVFPTTGDVAPIFVLGKENVTKQKQVTKFKQSLAEGQQQLATARQVKTSADSALDRFSIERARGIKESLRSSGTNAFNNYNKGDFTKRCDKMHSDADKAECVLDDSAREKLLAQLRSTPKTTLPKVAYRLPDLAGRAQAVKQLLNTTVVSSALQSLKDDAAVSAWVHAGLALHRRPNGSTCLFCDQALPTKRLAALEAHFSTEYEELLRRLDQQSSAIQADIDAATSVVMPIAAELYEDLSSDFALTAAALSAECNTARLALQALLKEIEHKKSRLFEQVSLKVPIPDLKPPVIDALNAVIQKHNQACNDFQSRIDAARKQLESDTIATSLDEYLQLARDIQGAEGEITKINEKVEQLTGDIATLEREIVEHRQPAEELNADLRNYLGHGELSLQVKDTGYAIMRNNSLAEALSEGEMTAIALLYFLKSLNDHRFDLINGVVVLDDPVSSLDANALYSAFGFIRSRTESVGQLIILTHNFALFRQVRNWFHRMKGQNKKDISLRPARFFMLACEHRDGFRCTIMQLLDPLLEQFESEYHYLFAYVYRTTIDQPASSLEKNYVLPNVARRLLEAFLAFRQPHIPGELWQKVQALQCDDAKKVRLVRFLHTYSHGDALAEAGHDLSMLGEAHAALKDMLEVMKSEDGDHYAAMETLVTTAGAGE